MNQKTDNTNEATRRLLDSIQTRQAMPCHSDAATSLHQATTGSPEVEAKASQKGSAAATPLTPEQKALLLIHNSPGQGLTAQYEVFGVKRTDAVSLFSELQEQCLINVEEFPQGRGGKLKVPIITEAGYRQIGEVDKSGVKGGGAHNITALCATKLFERAGYLVMPEYQLADEYAVQLDLMCRHKKMAKTVAVNICMNNAPSYEAQAAYRALQCPEVLAGTFMLIARDRSAIDAFKKSLRQMDKQFIKHVEFRLAGQVMKAANA